MEQKFYSLEWAKRFMEELDKRGIISELEIDSEYLDELSDKPDVTVYIVHYAGDKPNGSI